MSDYTTLEFSILNERIKAQIEIYEKFSQAFERTMEMLRAQGVKIDDIHDEVMGEVREIIKTLVSLSHDVRQQNESARERWLTFQNDLQHQNDAILHDIRGLSDDKHLWPSIQSTLSELKNYVLVTAEDTDVRHDRIEMAIKDLVAHLKLVSATQERILEVAESLVRDEKDRDASRAGVAEQVNAIFNDRNNLLTRLKMVGVFGLALSFLVGVIERCIQLGYLHLTWGPGGH